MCPFQLSAIPVLRVHKAETQRLEMELKLTSVPPVKSDTVDADRVFPLPDHPLAHDAAVLAACTDEHVLIFKLKPSNHLEVIANFSTLFLKPKGVSTLVHGKQCSPASVKYLVTGGLAFALHNSQGEVLYHAELDGITISPWFTPSVDAVGAVHADGDSVCVACTVGSSLCVYHISLKDEAQIQLVKMEGNASKLVTDRGCGLVR